MSSTTIYIHKDYKSYDFKSSRIWRTDGVYEPFVYIIQEPSSQKKYIGSRTEFVKRKALESDLGTTYFTSSEYVDWNSSEFEVVEIVKCASNHDALILESLLIKKYNAVWSEEYYNKHDPYIGFNLSGTRRSETTKKKISNSNSNFYKQNKHHMKGKFGPLHNNYGKTWSEETKSKMSKSKRGEKHYLYGKERSEETKAKISNSLKGKPTWNKGLTGFITLSEKTKIAMSKAHKGKRHSKEVKNKISFSAKNRKKVKCVHCSRMLDPGNYKQFHGPNCKHAKLNP